MNIYYDEEKEAWSEYKPYATIEVATEDDMKFFETAIKKQKKMFPVLSGNYYYDEAFCPQCRAELNFVGRPNYCPNCGQRLDWRDCYGDSKGEESKSGSDED